MRPLTAICSKALVTSGSVMDGFYPPVNFGGRFGNSASLERPARFRGSE